MKALLKTNLFRLPLLAIGSLLVSQQALAAKCVTDIALSSGKDNYVYNSHESALEIGYWDVDSGGASGKGSDLGSHFINISASVGDMSSQKCIEDLRLVAGAWNQQRNPPLGYEEAGWWDIDSGGSGDTNNNSSDGRMTLFVKKMAETSETPKGLQVIQDIGMSISDSKPSGASGQADSAGYIRVGWWDVDSDPGCGVLRGKKSCGTYGAILMVKKATYESGRDIKSLVLSGKWEQINACRGSHCGGTSYQISVGAESGKEISRSSTLGKSLSLMVGAEVTGTTGALPGGEVTAKVEVTGAISSEQQDSILNSFSISRQTSNEVSCVGASQMWQWRSTLKIQRSVGAPEDVDAGSLLTVCAPNGVKPPHLNDISWDPEVPEVASAPAGAKTLPLAGPFSFERGQKIYSPSGNHFVMFLGDGNLVINGREGNHIWGLDAVIRDKLGLVGSITFQADGNLVVSDKQGGYLWSAVHSAQPAGSTLRLNDNGALQIVRPDSSVAWEAGR